MALPRASKITVKPNTITHQPGHIIDYMATFIELANATYPKTYGDKKILPLEGKSLVPILKGSGASPHDALFWHYPHYSNQGGFPGGAIRVGDWKLIERYEDGRVHLFNIVEDPGERHDVAAGNGAQVERLRSRLHGWYEEVGARFLRARPEGPQPWSPQAVAVSR